MKIPPGSRNVVANAFWTTNGKESGKAASTEIEGDVVLANGYIRAHDQPFGAGTWGELHLVVTFEVPTEARAGS